MFLFALGSPIFRLFHIHSVKINRFETLKKLNVKTEASGSLHLFY